MMSAIVRNRLLSIAICLALFAANAGANDVVDQQIADMIPVFESGNLANVKLEAEKLAWSGLSTPTLFDVIEQRLVAVAGDTSKPGLQLTGWLIKALSYSGDTRYLSTLESLQGSSARKVRNYAIEGSERLEMYRELNPVLAANITGNTLAQVERQRVGNLLQSTNYEALRLGAKRVASAYRDDAELLGLARQRLLEEYTKGLNDKVYMDTMAWLVKALAESGDSAYRATLEEVANTTSDRKLAKRARKYASAL
jgi:hypothetical protein